MRGVAVLLMSALAMGCNPEVGPEPSDEPVTFQRVQDEVLSGSCGGSGCHGAVTAAGGLDLDSEGAYEQLFNAPCDNELATIEGLVRVAAGKPESSFLYVKLTDPRGMGEVMPPFGALSEDEVELVRRWIEGGALP